MNENKDLREERIELYREQYGLSEALLSVDTIEYRISLHIQQDSDSLWCNVTNGDFIIACDGVSVANILRSDNLQVVFGRMLDTSDSVEITLDGHTQIATSTIHIGSGVFLSSVPITQELAVTFKDQAGMVVHTEHLVIPEQPPVPLFVKLKLWLRGRGWLPSATDSATYHIE